MQHQPELLPTVFWQTLKCKHWKHTTFLNHYLNILKPYPSPQLLDVPFHTYWGFLNCATFLPKHCLHQMIPYHCLPWPFSSFLLLAVAIMVGGWTILHKPIVHIHGMKGWPEHTRTVSNLGKSKSVIPNTRTPTTTPSLICDHGSSSLGFLVFFSALWPCIVNCSHMATWLAANPLTYRTMQLRCSEEELEQPQRKV